MRVAIRVDASVAIGLGHVSRCLSLAFSLRATGATVVFAMRQMDVDASGVPRSAGFDVLLLGTGGRAANSDDENDLLQDWQSDSADTISALIPLHCDTVIVDHYSLDANWHRNVADALGASILVIDDLGNRPLAANIVVDHNISATRAKYAALVASDTYLMCGPGFALLGAAFRCGLAYQYREAVGSIGIFLGGIDHRNLSAVALRACRRLANFRGEIEIVTTSLNPKLEELRSVVNSDGAASLSVDLPNLAEFFSRHDLQIGAGGGAALERAVVGAPALLLEIADNQKAVVHAMVSSGAAASLEKPSDLSERSIGLAVLRMIREGTERRSISDRAKALVNCRGSDRVALFLMRTRLRVRAAGFHDSEKMLQWRNHEASRRVSRDSGEIDVRAHHKWLHDVLDDPNRVLMLGHVGSLDVGVIRFDRRSQGEFEVSLYLDPLLHGVGLGRYLLKAGEQSISQSNGATTICAHVLPSNATSKRLFAEAGYESEGDVWRKQLPMLQVSDL